MLFDFYEKKKVLNWFWILIKYFGTIKTCVLCQLRQKIAYKQWINDFLYIYLEHGHF